MMSRAELDELDLKILHELQTDCRIPIQDLAKKLGSPSSTIRYRVKRLEKDRIIEGYNAKINPEKVGMDYITIIRVIVHSRPDQDETIGQELAKIPGVGAVYSTLGEQDFLVLTRSANRPEFLKILRKIWGVDGVMRSMTQVIANVIKEETTFDLS